MKAVARLVYLYFTATPMTRALTVGGMVSCLFSLYVVTYLPQSEHMLAFAAAGQIAFFLGSTLMPLMVGRLAQGHAIRLLPHGRWKLLLSMFLTVAIVALPAGILTPFAYAAGMSAPAAVLGGHPKLLEFTINLACVIYTSSVIIAGWLYLVMWFLSSERNAAGFAKGMLVVVIMIFLPAREIGELSASTRWNLEQLAVAWTVFGTLFLLWPRLKEAWASRIRAIRGSRAAFSRSTTGREIDLILGTGNPWLLIAAQLIPIVIASRVGVRLPAIWLYFLTIFSTVTGAMAGQAAERSRALWLRGSWSRAGLFTEVEKSFLRHNCIVLSLLLVLMTLIGSQAGYSVVILAAGLPLLVLGTAVSTYLGLMLTRGLRWPEALLGIAVTITLMCVPLMLQAPDSNLSAVVVIEVLLALVALVFRSVAARRWRGIDWTQCRPPRALSLRGT
jgi:hypothetical protein